MGTDRIRIAVIGGGAAGLLAAAAAAGRGAEVMLFEKMDRVGLKMGITGKGRCNLTNSCPMDEFIGKTPGNGRFLYSAYHQFTNRDLIALFDSWGMKTVAERGGRVFPASQDAQEVRHLFMDKLHELGVHVHLSEPVTDIRVSGNRIAAAVTHRGVYPADACILATGGKSYPRTGSTGDGYRMAEKLGHTIVPLRPSLIPLVCADRLCGELQGLSLKNVMFTVYGDGKKKEERFGEMIFTHFGVSGPIVLSASDTASSLIASGRKVTASIDLKPALTEEILDKRIVRDLTKFHMKQMGNALQELLPHRLIGVILELAGISPELSASDLTKAQRHELGSVMKHMPLTVTGTRPLEEAIVTAGGVAVREINASTMESKRVSGLYLAGEVIDIHAFTGGFNLQAAFSTGYTAAVHAAGGESNA